MVEAAADSAASSGVGHHLRPVEQQIVVIEHVLALLGLDIGAEQPAQLRLPARAPGEAAASTSLERRLRR